MTTLSPAYHACPLRCLCDWSSNSCYSLTAASCVTGETRRTSIRNWRSASLPASLSVLSSLERRILCRTVKTNSLCVAYSMHEGLANIPSPQSVFIAVTICVPLAQCKFIGSRTVYEVRERPARMFAWSTFLVSEILIEIPWNMLGSSLFFFCWYWTSGFDSSRAAFSYLFYCVVFPLYYTTFGQAVVAISPNAVIASTLFSVLFSFVLILYVPLSFRMTCLSRTDRWVW